MSRPATRAPGFSSVQLIILTLIGAALWFLAAMILRWAGPMGAFEGGSRALLYVLVVPGTVPFVFLTKWIARLRSDQLALGIAWVTASALICDGIAFGWFPSLYGAAENLIVGSAGTVFWGAGVGIFLSFFLNKADPS